MADSNLILNLAKVVIAAAWVDGEIDHEEINNLKDLLFLLPDITGREWAILEMYIESPVGAAERTLLVERLKESISSSKDKVLALQALEEMIQADGVVTEVEQAAIREITVAIDEVDVGIIGNLARLMRSPLQRRMQVVDKTPHREEHFEDFIKNKVYYGVRRRLDVAEGHLDIPESNLRQLCLAGGLTARIAQVDRVVTQDEFSVMVKALQVSWDTTLEVATFVAEVAVSEIAAELDYYRLTRGFFDSTNEAERLRFLDVLFAVADADGRVSYDEIEEIRAIARSIKLDHKQFIAAKVRIPRKRRDG